jgi:hypothetical protein
LSRYFLAAKQKSQEQSPKVAENDTPELEITGKEKVKNELVVSLAFYRDLQFMTIFFQ